MKCIIGRFIHSFLPIILLVFIRENRSIITKAIDGHVEGFFKMKNRYRNSDNFGCLRRVIVCSITD